MKVKYSIPFLIVVLIFGFGLFTSCSTEEIKVEEVKVEEPKSEEITEVSLKIIVWNDTVENEPNLEIWIKGTGSWYPDKESMGFGGDFFIPVEPFSNEGINEIYIYPDGRTGNEIIVEIIINDEMTPESDRDTIHIEISDETVIVTGTSIAGITKEFER
ncbi:MAG: hypothetical protein ISS14_04840 [Actinobacteria bacterium]|nr:hypothetical protein [Actinomycetota bacterium]MBL7124197.1 hypothetical protein [Actinomycetota bacterium]